MLPWLLATVSQPPPGIGRVFATFCHQDSARTLTLAAPMLVCSRCAGIFAGMALAAVFPWPRWGGHRWKRLLLGSVVLMCLDVATQDLGLRPPWHSTRLGTGLAVGWLGVAAMVRTLMDEARGRGAVNTD